MKGKPQFSGWKTVPDMAGRSISGLTRKAAISKWTETINEYLDDVRSSGKQPQPCDTEILTYLASAEVDFIQLGSPYFKVWPAMESMLNRTKLNFSGSCVHSPYGVIEVRCDKGRSFLVRVFEPKGSAEDQLKDCEHTIKKYSHLRKDDYHRFMLEDAESSAEKIREFGRSVLSMILFWRDENYRCAARTLPIYENQIIEDVVNRDQPTIDDVDLTEQNQMVAIAISVCMFAIDRHELVAPDIDREVIERKYPGGRSKGSQAVAAEQIKREIAKCKGWKIGSEIDLPRPQVIRTGEPQKLGTELEFGHVRSGHMRMQPCGEGNKDRKLIFVPPTIVRPDLPIRQSHGYRIQDKLLEKKRKPVEADA